MANMTPEQMQAMQRQVSPAGVPCARPPSLVLIRPPLTAADTTCPPADGRHGPGRVAGTDGTGTGHDGRHVARPAPRAICRGGVTWQALPLCVFAVCAPGALRSWQLRAHCPRALYTCSAFASCRSLSRFLDEGRQPGGKASAGLYELGGITDLNAARGRMLFNCRHPSRSKG